MESLSNILFYRFELPTFNDLTRILLHDKATKELRGKRIKNEALLLKTKFGKVKNQHERNNHKGPITKRESNYNFYRNPDHWTCNYVELSNEIKCHNNDHEHFKIVVNMIEKGNDEEVDNFQNDIDALTINVLELNLYQYSNTFYWFINCGASKHVIGNNKLLANIKDDRGTPMIKTVGRITHLVVGKGNFVIHVGNNVEMKEEILYVLGVNSNLLSIGVFIDKGFVVFFNYENVFLMDSKLNVVETNSRDTMNGLYKFSIPHEMFCGSTTNTIDLTRIWHQHLGHLNVKNLHLLSHKCLVTNMPTIPDQSFFVKFTH